MRGERPHERTPGGRHVGYLYFLAAALCLLGLVTVYWMIMSILKQLAKVKIAWLLTRSAKLDEFREWTQEVCAQPWQQETVLCQAADGSWLARELVRAKLQQAGADHCDPELEPNGCRQRPCPSKGLAKVLLDVADGFRSPLNNPFNPAYLVLIPVRAKLKAILRRLALGKMPLSELDKQLQAFPWKARVLDEERRGWFGVSSRLRRGSHVLKLRLLNRFVYPIMREWGVVIGGNPTHVEDTDDWRWLEMHSKLFKLDDEAEEEEADSGVLGAFSTVLARGVSMVSLFHREVLGLDSYNGTASDPVPDFWRTM